MELTDIRPFVKAKRKGLNPKLLWIMKISAVILLFSFLHLPAFSEGQTVTIKLKNAGISKVFWEIQKQTGLGVFLDQELVRKTGKVSMNVTNMPVLEALEVCCVAKGLSFSIVGERIVVRSDEVASSPTNIVSNSLPPPLQVKGRVQNEAGEPMVGVSVVIKQNKRAAVTDSNGYYSINVEDNETLVFSYVGYLKQEIEVNKRQSINVTLILATSELSDIVVTALGIKKKKRSLTYSVADLKGDDLSVGTEANVANELSGKVAGVQVSRPASGAGGSSKVIIRGYNSLQSSSQPLYVVDGIPMNNNNLSPANNWSGIDYGDGISNINPNDIENISILKGPNAAALYGQQGSNGVVLITTKSGKTKKGIGINYTADYSIGAASVLPDFQNEYGQGLNGNFTHFRNSADNKIYTMPKAIAQGMKGIPKASGGRDRLTRGSWGAPADGREYEDNWGNILKLTPQPDTYQKFFNNEKQLVNTLSVDGGSKDINYRLSYSNLYSDGYVPTNKLNRNTFTFRTTANITPKLTVDAKVNYIKQKAKNRPFLSNTSTNPAYLFISQPRSIPMDIIKDYEWTANDASKQLGYSSSYARIGAEKTYGTNSSSANPYWTIYKSSNSDERDRVLGMLNLNYEILPWLNASLRGGTDFYTDQHFHYKPIGTVGSSNKQGEISEIVYRVQDKNADAILSANFGTTEKISFAVNAGAGYQKKFLRSTGNLGYEFVIPDLFVVNNTLRNSYTFDLAESEIHSLYASGQVSYKNLLFVDFSGRNDWSSTLPPKNNSFFYPSIGSSLILSDVLKISSPNLNYLKIRASLAQSGSSGNPYQTMGTFSLEEVSLNGLLLGYYTNTIPSPDLKNELTTSVEFGTDVNLFHNRLSLSLTYYKASTKNQILDVPLPSSTTFESKRLNAGKIENKGIEASIEVTPVKTQSGFVWSTSLNFSRNRNRVVELYPGVSTFILGSDRNVSVVAEAGKPFGTLLGTGFAWLKDAQGNRLIDPDTGLPLRTSATTITDLGTAMPDWIGGFSNTINYKGFSFGALVDIRSGGKIFSQSVREELIYGTTRKTLQGRDGSYIAEGVVAQQDGSGGWKGTSVKNTKPVFAQDYWNEVASDKDNVISEEMINDASYISMREMSLSYRFSADLFKNKIIKNVVIGLYGRNLFYFKRKTDGFAPEASSFNVNNSSIGLESTSLPLLRYIGINLNVTF